MTCYDLDAETISGVQLIEPQAYNCRKDGVAVSLEMDAKSSNLRFTMAFSILDQGIPGQSLPSKVVHIWVIDCTINSSGHAIGLHASKLASFPHQSRLYSVYSISLRGPLLAIAAGSTGANPFMAVIDWKDVDGRDNYSWWVVNQCQGSVGQSRFYPTLFVV